MQFPCRSTFVYSSLWSGKRPPLLLHVSAKWKRGKISKISRIYCAHDLLSPGERNNCSGRGEVGLKDCVPVARTLEMALGSDQLITICKQLRNPRWSKHESVLQAFEPRPADRGLISYPDLPRPREKQRKTEWDLGTRLTVDNLVDSSRWSVAPGKRFSLRKHPGFSALVSSFAHPEGEKRRPEIRPRFAGYTTLESVEK